MTLAPFVFVALGAVCPPADTGDPCPEVYRIHGETPPEHALNILVMSDGFTEDDLGDYRCAVQLMFEQLLSYPPYDRYACAINVYRMDLASPHSGMRVRQTCGRKTCDDLPVHWSDQNKRTQCANVRRGDPMRGSSDACIEIDLEIGTCPSEEASCRVAWPDFGGQAKIWRLATCAPNIHTVVVVANSGDWAGSGTNQTHPALVVTALPGIDSEDTRSRLIVHEIGHALGLLDEYSFLGFSGGGGPPGFLPGRNVARAVGGSVDEIPWAEQCTGPDGECTTACDPGCGDCPDGRVFQPVVGLWEGAYYKSCDYYRGSSTCFMRDSQADDAYCEVCRNYLSGFFEDLGHLPCDVLAD